MFQNQRIFQVAEVISKIKRSIVDHMDCAVLAMSGGADSTLCAILCQEALGAEHVHSVHMPYGARDNKFFNHRSIHTAKHLKLHIHHIPITDAVNTSLQVCENALGEPLEKVNKGNIRSRERMKVLYTIAHHIGSKTKKRVRTIGTGNLSEDFIGYDTKFGDAACDLFIIGELLKSEVYQLLDYFRDRGTITEDMIDRVPSAGLWEQQTDEQELGFSYKAMANPILELQDEMYESCQTCGKKELHQLAEDSTHDAEIKKFVRQRHLSHRHKHLAPEVTKVFS